MKQKTIKIEITGMTCDHCAKGIEKLIGGKEGVTEADVHYQSGKGEFSFDSDKISKDDIVNVINKTKNYRVKSVSESGNHESSGNHFDLIIIGGGSAAFSAAIKANESGISALLINGGLPIGGTCVNVGCVPSKFIIRAAEKVHNANNSNFKGIKPCSPVIDFGEIIRQKTDLVTVLQKKKYLNLIGELEHVKVIEGIAEFTSDKTIAVNGNDKYTANKFIIATGSTTLIPDISGLKDVPYLTNITLFELEKQPESLIVLGAGYIALEIAQAYNRLGTKVTIIQRSDRILSKEAEDISNELNKYLLNEGLQIITNTKKIQISNSTNGIMATFSVNDKIESINASHILVATGITPNTSKLGFKNIGVNLIKSGHIKVNEHLQTNVDYVYAAGDVADTPPFVYTAAYEGRVSFENAFGFSETNVDYSSMPWVIFTDPQVAGVGMDERDAEELGIPFEISVVPLTEVPRALAAGDTRGFVKLIRNPESDKLIGARIIAPEGGELVMQISLAIKYGIKVNDLANTLYPYLTLSEAIKLAAISFGKDVTKLSCCAS